MFHPGTSTPHFRNLNPRKQETIVDAALTEFAVNGYRHASMNRLVKAAGISKGSLFQYFRTKDNLFNQVLEIAVGEVKGYLRAVRDGTRDQSLFQRLEALLRAGFLFIDEHPRLARIYFTVLSSGEAPFGARRLLDLHRRSTGFLADLIEEALDRNEIRPEVDVHCTAFLINALFEKLLRAYYTEHVASGLGLYHGDSGEVDRWIHATLELVHSGLVRPCPTEDTP